MSRDMQVEEKMMELDELKPDILSIRMWADTPQAAFHPKGWHAGVNFFHKRYERMKQTVHKRFISQALQNYLHIVLIRTLTIDLHSSCLRFLCGTYKEANAFCKKQRKSVSTELA
jgi:hypothetical protein